jgi:hypothetical protein
MNKEIKTSVGIFLSGVRAHGRRNEVLRRRNKGRAF